SGDPSSGGASAGFTRARNASSMTASLLFHQRYRVAVLTPACLANSCADTDAIPRFFSRRYAARGPACFEASLGGRPRGRGLEFRDLRIGTAGSQRFGKYDNSSFVFS